MALVDPTELELPRSDFEEFRSRRQRPKLCDVNRDVRSCLELRSRKKPKRKRNPEDDHYGAPKKNTKLRSVVSASHCDPSPSRLMCIVINVALRLELLWLWRGELLDERPAIFTVRTWSRKARCPA
ncbi:hypothetical protein D1O30_03570 [Methylocystis hirsuta]|uniref:Uncharacterized protein n=1 Tax=Methylocystis hirsuta TaxID=369798 RepID=A0A3M9XL87_9HYPH|nr:hypothetical protein D1O30_03570 [Methylocystis hirsuta]